jgi:hypothetical protein
MGGIKEESSTYTISAASVNLRSPLPCIEMLAKKMTGWEDNVNFSVNWHTRLLSRFQFAIWLCNG